MEKTAKTAAKELIEPIQKAGALEMQDDLQERFAPHYFEAKTALDSAAGIEVTDPDDYEGIKKAREARLELRRVRTAVEATRKKIKADITRKGKAIDGIANVIKYMIEPIEKQLHDYEKIAEIREQERKTALREKRAAQLEAVNVDPSVYVLEDMTETAFAQTLEMATAAYNREIEEQKRQEQEREQRAAEQAAENERIRKENEKLKKEAAEKEKAAAAAQAEAAAAARKEKERQDAEIAERQREAAEQARRDMAPDVKKLQYYAEQLKRWHGENHPRCTTEAGRKTAGDIDGMIERMVNFITDRAGGMQ